MEYNPKVSVIIPTKNRCKALQRFLSSLLKQTYRDFEIVIVDGGSVDKTLKVIQDFSDKIPIVFTTQAGGLVRQENKGWRIAKGEIIIRTDDDVLIEPNWIEAIVNTFNLSYDVGGVTGPTVISEENKGYRDLFYFQKKLTQGTFLWKMLGKIYFNYFLEGEPLAVSKWFKCGAFSLGSNYEECLNIKEPFEVTNQEACNMAIRKDILAKINGFDESYKGIGEYNEPDTTFKIRKLGYRILFNPKVIVYHLPSKEGFFNDRPNSYYRILNFINFYFRHIKPNTLDKFIRFFSYLLFLNGFFIFKAVTTGQVSQLGSVPATLVGLGKNIFRLNSWLRN